MLSGIDAPGISSALFSTLEPFSITILDIEQVVIRSRLILTVLIDLDPAHAAAVESDLNECAKLLNVDIATSFSSETTQSIAQKTGLIHVIALAEKITPGAIANLASDIATTGGNIERIHRSASFPLTAIEFLVSDSHLDSLRKALGPTAKKYGIDIAIQISGLNRFARKLVVMDVDSTLISQEVIDLLAEASGVGQEVRAITESAMRGELDFETSLRKRVALLKGQSESIIADVAKAVTLTPGARTLIRTLKKLGHGVGLVSGGFSQVVDPIAKQLGIEHVRSNTLEIVDGVITGNLLGAIIDRAGKAIALKEFASLENVSPGNTIAIGDGANDLDMIAAAGLGIAFNAKPTVQAAAQSALNAPYLDSVLFILGINREDIEESEKDI
ncbi:MAG: phosphoserine phosphatase SerB [Actinobacteria bacterium]|nr:phosphoserine phosphatase SerB [Actinomycetota bacterium]